MASRTDEHGGSLRVGVDLDNTIVCYDELFHRLAVDRGLIPPELPATKTAVRSHLVAAGREETWTALQGEAYGVRMAEARPYAGVAELLRRCERFRVDVFVVSHRTRTPYRGPSHDLHGAAVDWLEANGFFTGGGRGLSRERVFLEADRAAKAERIATLGCTHFVDDLAEFLVEPALPPPLVRVHFDPSGEHRHARDDGERDADHHPDLVCIDSWTAIADFLLGEAPTRPGARP